MPAELLAKVTAEQRTAFWERALQAERGDRQRIAVADVDGTAVGFVWTGPCRDTEDTQDLVDSGELYAINVAPRYWGSGVGTALLKTAHESLAAQGFSHAVLWVVAGNVRARRFYDRAAWAFDGVTRDDELGGFLIPEVRYGRSFTVDSPGTRTGTNP